jgi:hypothetical protein
MTTILLTETQTARRAELDKVIEKGAATFYEVAIALAEIKHEGLWRSTHESFGLYCEEKLGRGGSYSYEVAAAGEVLGDLAECEILPSSANQVRPLQKLKPEQRREAWEAAVEVSKGAGRNPNKQVIESAARSVQEERPTFEPGQKVTVQAGDFAGTEVEIIDVKGVVITARTDEAVPLALLSTELASPRRIPESPKATSIKNHPLAHELEISGVQANILEARVCLLEGLLRQAVFILPIGDLRRRIQAIL